MSRSDWRFLAVMAGCLLIAYYAATNPSRILEALNPTDQLIEVAIWSALSAILGYKIGRRRK